MTWRHLILGESVNRSQIDIKRRTCDIRTWKKNLFLHISSTIDTFVPSLYQCVQTRSIEVFWLLSQPFPHLRFNLFILSETFATVVNRFMRQMLSTINISLRIYFAISPFPHKKYTTTLLFGSMILKHGCHSDYWNQLLNICMHVCYLDCHEAGLCCYLVIYIETYYAHYSCFTSICGLFTDSP
jgi:hypothetical protein